MATNYMESLRTMTGFTIMDAMREMMKVLPPAAYKAIPGQKKKGPDGREVAFTDIDPAYLTSEVSRIFGMAGIGWKMDYAPEAVSQEWKAFQKSNGQGEYYRWVVSVPYLTVQVRYVDADGNFIWSDPIPANGSNKNEDPGYAMRGAITNAISGAFAKMCWQLPVYMGKVTHENAREKYEKQRELAAKGPNGSTPAPVQETDPEELQGPVIEIDNEEQEEVPVAEVAPEPVKQAVKEAAVPGTEPEVVTLWAQNLVIPADLGIPLAGKTLGVAKNQGKMGKGVLEYLAGVSSKKDGTMFEPGDNKVYQDLHRAAKALYEAN